MNHLTHFQLTPYYGISIPGTIPNLAAGQSLSVRIEEELKKLRISSIHHTLYKDGSISTYVECEEMK